MNLGPWLAASGRSVPYTIQGDLVAEHLSDYYDSDATAQMCSSM